MNAFCHTSGQTQCKQCGQDAAGNAEGTCAKDVYGAADAAGCGQQTTQAGCESATATGTTNTCVWVSAPYTLGEGSISKDQCVVWPAALTCEAGKKADPDDENKSGGP